MRVRLRMRLRLRVLCVTSPPSKQRVQIAFIFASTGHSRTTLYCTRTRTHAKRSLL